MITHALERVTPAQAEQYMPLNTHNRNMRISLVRSMAEDMKLGRWRSNGETLKFGNDDRGKQVLLDGQKRLMAVIESGCTVEFLVVRGLTLEDQETMDVGQKRTFAQVLQLRGVPNYNQVASITYGVFQWENGIRKWGGGEKVATHAQLSEVLEKYPWIVDAVATARSCNSKAKLTPAVGGTLWWVFMQIDPDDAEFFFHHLATGSNLPPGHPILALRNELLRPLAGRAAERNKSWMYGIVCKAWNKFRDGEMVQNFGYRQGGAAPEKFPEPR